MNPTLKLAILKYNSLFLANVYSFKKTEIVIINIEIEQFMSENE